MAMVLDEQCKCLFHQNLPPGSPVCKEFRKHNNQNISSFSDYYYFCRFLPTLFSIACSFVVEIAVCKVQNCWVEVLVSWFR